MSMVFYFSIDLLIDTGYFDFDCWEYGVLTWALMENLNLEFAAHGYTPRREIARWYDVLF